MNNWINDHIYTDDEVQSNDAIRKGLQGNQAYLKTSIPLKLEEGQKKLALLDSPDLVGSQGLKHLLSALDSCPERQAVVDGKQLKTSSEKYECGLEDNPSFAQARCCSGPCQSHVHLCQSPITSGRRVQAQMERDLSRRKQIQQVPRILPFL